VVITILSEPRSGSTNLANWFYYNKDFTVLYEPITNRKLKWYKNEIPPTEWNYTTEHLLVKEICHNMVDYSELLNISDKIIILYRENYQEQLLSLKNAISTDNWDKQWVYNKKLEKNYNTTVENGLTNLKNNIRENYIDKDYFQISYEELYYNNGFQRIVDYIDLPEVKNVNFPYGTKYRVDIKEDLKKLI
jgi:hypothetical protein